MSTMSHFATVLNGWVFYHDLAPFYFPLVLNLGRVLNQDTSFLCMVREKKDIAWQSPFMTLTVSSTSWNAFPRTSLTATDEYNNLFINTHTQIKMWKKIERALIKNSVDIIHS